MKHFLLLASGIERLFNEHSVVYRFQAICGLIFAFYLLKMMIGLNTLTLLVKSQGDGGYIRSLLSAVSIIYKSKILYIYTQLYGAHKKSKNIYTVDYIHNHQWYSVPITIKRGFVEKIEYAKSVKDDIEYDCTSEIVKLAGPNVNFHSQDLTPRDLGYSEIKIKREGCEQLLFTANQSLRLQ